MKQEINKQVEATVDWDKFSLNFFRGFPDLSINLHGLSVIGREDFKGDTLVALNRFELRVSPFSALKKNVIVKSILLDRPHINGIVLEDGTANYDIVPEGETKNGEEIHKEKSEKPETGKAETEVETGGTSMGLALKRFAIQHARISYQDAPMGLYAKIDDLDLELKGDFSLDQTELDLMLSLKGIYAKSGGIPYMRNGNFEVDLTAAADMVNSVYTLEKNEIRLNGLILGMEGTVDMPEDGSIHPDIRFFTKNTSFKTLLSMVPAIYLADFESLKTSGSLALEGSVNGVMKDTILPNAIVKLKVMDGYFSYPDLPKDVSDVQVAVNINFNGSDMDATKVSLEKFHLLLGGNPFDMSLDVEHPFSDMHVAGMVKGMIDFATLKDIVPMEELDLSGRLDTDLKWDTKMSYIENEQFEKVDLDGKFIIEGVYLEAPDIPVPVQIKKMAMLFTPKYVNLETVDLLLGSSDLHLDGRLTNFIPYVFDGRTVSGTLNVTSTLLDANEFLSESDTEDTLAVELENDTLADSLQDTLPAPPPPDSLALPSQLKIPENIDFKMTLDLKKLIYDNIIAEHLAGKMGVKDGIASIDMLTLDILDGSVSVTGTVDPRGEFTEADVALNLTGIDIPTSYKTFVTIEKLAPVAQNVKGSANVEMELFTQLDASFNPLYESIDANGHLFARNLKIEQTATLEKLASVLKNEKMRNMEVEKADIRFAIRKGRVIVDPFDINFDNSKITASGSHGIDQTMDYLLDMKIAKTDLGSGAYELMNSVGALAAGAGFAIPQSENIKVKAKITGTFKDPKVKTDLSENFSDSKTAVTTVVKEKAKEEIKKVETKVREEAGDKADELIKNAESEKAKLIKQAESAGEKLRKEAQTQGDKLIKEAGSNPIKQIAAKKAAEQLVKQADKQAAKLIQEAEAKGDALIAKAKEEAGKI